ncbi:MAG TPA: uroporphyrinogen-III C-methyltransferase [Moraxellaceae bacterium]
MTPSDKQFSPTRIPLVSGAVVAVRARPWLAYVLALGALLLAGYVWKLAHDEGQALQAEHARLLQLESRLADNQRQQQRLVDDLTLRSRQLDELHARMARWDSSMNADQRRAWLLTETDHYLRLAQQHLSLTRDIIGARTLLDVADRLVAAQSDNRLLPLREAIARDRMALSAALGVDVAGVYLRLGALSEHVGSLQLPILAGERKAQRGDVVPAPVVTQESGLLAEGWAKVRALVTVRHYEEPLRPLLSEADRALVREAVRLDLAQAQLGLLRGEPAIYQASLQAAKARLGRYFPLLPKAELNDLQQELNALAEVDIRPALPDLGNSLRALDALSAGPRVPAALSETPAPAKPAVPAKKGATR